MRVCARVWTDSGLSWLDYRELGEEQTEGGGGVRPHPSHEHPGHCGGSHRHPPGCQPVSLPPYVNISR